MKEGQSQEPPGPFSSFIGSLMLSKEVTGYPRLRAVSPNTESGDNRQMRLEIPGIKIACRRKEKKEIQKLLLFLTQVADPHQCALRPVRCPQVFVSCATTDPSHKALLGWFVTRHAIRNGTERETPEATICPIKIIMPGPLCSKPCSASEDLACTLYLVHSRTLAAAHNNSITNNSTELSDSAPTTIWIV